jgi:cytochrome b involved in lipid metabolism
VFVQIENKSQRINLINAPPQNTMRERRDLVDVFTNDDEVFPVARRLLRPCISLTAVVQQGYGKYKEAADEQRKSVNVDLDACTFDRVLLYLEHEARGEEFNFDPLLTNELLTAAELLGISGLRDLCLKKLGNFQDRVRKTPIRLDEVIAKNKAGSDAAETSPDGKRTITWLILNGMVLDISRWLEEHPGGSSIIPRQSLNIDSTLFFEIYHASRQSFLYLKEFYIGELFVDDLPRLLPLPESPSAAFLEELNRTTSWRLKPEDLTLPVATHLGVKATHS